ncbi:MAG: ABC transporter permease subunit [Geminicoccaceae bacterium]
MSNATADAAIIPARDLEKGRSLWSDAMRRLRANKAAVAAIFTLALMAFACVIGPMISPHPFDKVYQSYVKARPSLEPYPTAEQIQDDLERALRRARVTVDSFSVEGDTLAVTLSADEKIDPRMTRYIDRVDAFANARITSEENDGRILHIEADVARTLFLAGTDQNGRDLLTRILIGGRVSLAIGLLATFVALLIGVAWGAVAGYAGGRIDQLMMRFVDVLYSLPFIFFVIMLVVFFGRNFILMFIAVGAVEWLDMARIVRGQTLSIKRQEYVEAARALGVSQWHIIWRHIVPNALGPVVIYMTLLVPKVILLESFLSFLGLGVQEPMTSWGVLISEGARNIQDAPYLLIYPSIFLAITLLCLNFIGDGLRDALDPKDR